MEADRGFLPGEKLWHTSGALLHEAEGEDNELDRRDGKHAKNLLASTTYQSITVLRTADYPDHQVDKLRQAMREYETDRWRIVSAKVGNGFSPAACRDRAAELQAEADLEAEEGYEQTELGGGSSDPAVPFQ